MLVHPSSTRASTLNSHIVRWLGRLLAKGLLCTLSFSTAALVVLAVPAGQINWERDMEGLRKVITQEPLVAFVFAGCGWMHPFEFGAAKFIQEYFDTGSPYVRFAGTSAGAVVASGLAVGVEVGMFFEEALTNFEPCQNNPFYMGDSVKKTMEKIFPGDASWRNVASGRLGVGLTTLGMGWLGFRFQPEVVSRFSGRRHAIDVLRASCHIPLFGGVMPYYVPGHAKRYYDGAIAAAFPSIERCEDLRVSRAADGASIHHQFMKIKIDGRPLEDDIHIVPDLGYTVPPRWAFMPLQPQYLRKIFTLGYIRTAQYLKQLEHQGTISHIQLRPLPDPQSMEVELQSILADLEQVARQQQEPWLQPWLGSWRGASGSAATATGAAAGAPARAYSSRTLEEMEEGVMLERKKSV